MNVILDTSGWYAFLTPDDVYHTDAVNFVKQKPHIVVPFTVLEELSALVHNRRGKDAVLAGVGKLLTSPLVEVYYFSEEESLKIWDTYSQTPTYIDYVDASVIWLAKQTSFPIFGFDKHFRKMKMTLVLEE